jgi:hypothetical protein
VFATASARLVLEAALDRELSLQDVLSLLTVTFTVKNVRQLRDGRLRAAARVGTLDS